MGHEHRPEPPDHFHNRLKEVRVSRGFSQGVLATKAGITRQAISSIESHHYLPTTAVALRLAAALTCRVEDLFSLVQTDDVIEGTFLGPRPNDSETASMRVKIAKIGARTVIRPVTKLGDVLSYTVPADGYLIETMTGKSNLKARVRLSRDSQAIEREISVAGCDPAIFLAGEHMRRQKDRSSVVGWTMGSMAALHALKQGEVHVAGLHLYDPVSGESNLPFLRRVLKGGAYDVVTFATWEEGFLVRRGNPKSIHTAGDLGEASVTLINREEGSGARFLLDQRLRAAGLDRTHVQGYENIVSSHFEVARAIAGRQADVGIGIRSAAQLFGLEFVPLQSARYDLVVPKAVVQSHPTIGNLFEAINSQPFRAEIEALGGYDTTETGKLHAFRS